MIVKLERQSKNSVTSQNLKTIALTTDEVSYLVELLNNERYTSNSNATLAESLITVLYDTPSLSDEEIDAQIDYAMVTR